VNTSTFDLKDKIVLVAGASAGIGEALSEQLAERGARVIAAARRTDKLDAMAKQFGDRIYPLALDVSDTASTASLIERLPEPWRDIHAAVVSAGHDAGGRAMFHEGSTDAWTDIIETNVNGTIRVCRAVIDLMRSRGSGHIVTLGSVSGIETYAGGTIYSASKFAVHAFTDSLCKDYKTEPIRVTEVLPGLTRTEFAQNRWGGDASKADSFYDAAPDTLEAGDVARTIIYALELPEHINIRQLVVTATGNK